MSQPSWQSAAAQRWDSMGVLSSGALQQTQSWPRLRPQPTLEAQLLEVAACLCFERARANRLLQL